MVTQPYATHVSPNYVIKGNDAILKCDIPSFLVDVVQVFSWVDDQNSIYSPNSVQLGRGNLNARAVSLLSQKALILHVLQSCVIKSDFKIKN